MRRYFVNVLIKIQLEILKAIDRQIDIWIVRIKQYYNMFLNRNIMIVLINGMIILFNIGNIILNFERNM